MIVVNLVLLALLSSNSNHLVNCDFLKIKSNTRPDGGSGSGGGGGGSGSGGDGIGASLDAIGGKGGNQSSSGLFNQQRLQQLNLMKHKLRRWDKNIYFALPNVSSSSLYSLPLPPPSPIYSAAAGAGGARSRPPPPPPPPLPATFGRNISNSRGKVSSSASLSPHQLNAVIDCGDPGYVAHASRNEPLKFTYEQMVNFTCDQGYKSLGPPFIFCTKSGRWNRPLPQCVLNTCPPLTVNDASVIVHYDHPPLNVGTKAIVGCRRGYRFEKEKVPPAITCQWTGNWSTHEIPACIKSYCVKPSSPSHAQLQFIPNKEAYNVSDTVLARCQHSSQRTFLHCEDDGSWSSSPPVCGVPKNSYCSGIKRFPNGVHNGSSYNHYKIGTKLVFKCLPNYFLQGAPWIYCTKNGTWTSSVPSCSLSNELTVNHDKSYRLTLLLTSILITVILILLTVFVLLIRWRQRTLQRRHWRRYFGNYTYRQSKTNIYHNNQEMKLFKQSKIAAVPVTDL